MTESGPRTRPRLTLPVRQTLSLALPAVAAKKARPESEHADEGWPGGKIAPLDVHIVPLSPQTSDEFWLMMASFQRSDEFE